MMLSLTTFRNVALAALVGLAACGDDDDSNPSAIDALTASGVGVDGAADIGSPQSDASNSQIGADVPDAAGTTQDGSVSNTSTDANGADASGVDAAGVGPDASTNSQDTGPAAAPWVLQLPPNGSHVDHGVFWPSDTEIGNTWWEAWFAPSSDHLGYVVSDGYGGAHAMLLGINEKGAITGNFWHGTNKVLFTGSPVDRVAVGEWVHVAVGFERSVEKAIVIYVNGMLTGYQPFDGSRWSSNVKTGSGILYVGGSTHAYFHGRIAWVRAFDDDLFPRDRADILTAFRPSTSPAASEVGAGILRGTPVTGATFYADFLASYLLPPGTTTVPDLSVDGVRPPPARVKTSHPGKVDSIETEPLKAAFVQDPTAPFMGNVPQDRPQVPVTALAVPAGAKIFDSFARTNQDFTRTASPTLGRTEAGSFGPLQWQTLADQPFGLRNAHAVFLGSKTLSPAWVDSGSGDHVVQVLNAGFAGVNNKGGAAVVFRMSDADNLWAAIISGPFSVTLRKVVNKVATDFGPFPIPTNWTGDISVDAKGSSISVQARRGVGGWLELTKVDDAFNSTATKVGFASASGSYARVKSFLVK